MAEAFEAARRNPTAGLLACAVGFAVVLILGYWVDPFPRWDKELLLAVRSAPDTFANDLAFAVERLVGPVAQVGWAVLAALLALWLRRPRRALMAVAEVAGTAVLVQSAEDRPRAPPLPPHPRRPVLLASGGEVLSERQRGGCAGDRPRLPACRAAALAPGDRGDRRSFRPRRLGLPSGPRLPLSERRTGRLAGRARLLLRLARASAIVAAILVALSQASTAGLRRTV